MANRISVDVAIDILRRFFEGSLEVVREERTKEGECYSKERKSNNSNAAAGQYYDGKYIPNAIWINDEIIHLYLVGQKESYENESERGHIFSPLGGYPKMFAVQPKDIILSYQKSMIKSVNVALESVEQTYGVIDGLRADCIYSELQNPVNIDPIRNKLAGLKPFSAPNGHLPQRGYIHELDVRAAKILHSEIIKNGNTPTR